MPILNVLVAIGIFLGSLSCGAQELVKVKLEFENLRSSKGQILVGVYTDETSFKKEKSVKDIIVPKRLMRDGKVTYEVELPEGTYGIAVCDDENANDKMDYTFVGWPKEGFGFSNHQHTGMSKPAFEEFQFTIESGRSTRVKVPLRYM